MISIKLKNNVVKTYKNEGRDYEQGAYGWVVFDKSEQRAIKIFKTDKPDNHIKKVFNSEVDAYKIASNHEELKSIVPKFYELVEIQLLNTYVNGIKNEHTPHYAYAMSYEEGRFKKINLVTDKNEVERIKSLFTDNGIAHIIDASVIEDSKGKIIKVIDFSLEEHELMHDDTNYKDPFMLM